MDKTNKKRILKLVEILRRYSNEDKHLKLSEIISYLEESGISVNNRKTLYDDFKILNESGINVEYDNGYYLLEAPFNLSEIKIIQDSINSLKNLDNKFLDNLNDKLYAFISLDEQALLENLKYTTFHKDKKLLQRMEDILKAIKEHKAVNIRRNNGKNEDIFPIFIHRNNDYYYFYYHYDNSKKLYHYRFDNVSNITLLDKIDNLNISKREIINKINESSNSFNKNDSTEVSFKINGDKNALIDRIINDFPNAIITKDGFSIVVSINNNFFSKIVNYDDEIKIINKDVAKKYQAYLEKIIAIYH